jgi:hypothetical protein
VPVTASSYYVGLIAAALVAATASAAATQPLPGHALLVDRAGLRVYGPPVSNRASCPHTLPLPPTSLATVRRAVALAMPPFEAALKLDGRNPSVHVVRASDSHFASRAGGCGRTTWTRSIVASVSLPHIRNSASLAHHTFAVARVRTGWILWAWIH